MSFLRPFSSTTTVSSDSYSSATTDLTSLSSMSSNSHQYPTKNQKEMQKSNHIIVEKRSDLSNNSYNSTTHRPGPLSPTTSNTPTTTSAKSQSMSQPQIHAPLTTYHNKNTLKLSNHDIKKLRTSWNSMLNDIFDESSDSSEENEGRSISFYAAKSLKAVSSGQASSLFCRQLYMNLLAEHPDLESIFPTIYHQAAALSGVITITINSLENLSILDDYLNCIGRRHSRVLGIECEHFEMMAEALITTFSDRFGEMFTFELENLWLRLYQYLANKLLENYTEKFILLENDEPITMKEFKKLQNPKDVEDKYTEFSAKKIVSNPISTITNTLNDQYSLYSSVDSTSSKQKPSPHGSLETVLTNVSFTEECEDNKHFNEGFDSTANIKNFGLKKNGTLSKFVSFYKPKK